MGGKVGVSRSERATVHFIVRLYLVSIIEHAKAWLSQLKKKLGENPVDLLKVYAD